MPILTSTYIYIYIYMYIYISDIFLNYINDIVNVSDLAEFIMFADDANIFLTKVWIS